MKLIVMDKKLIDAIDCAKLILNPLYHSFALKFIFHFLLVFFFYKDTWIRVQNYINLL